MVSLQNIISPPSDLKLYKLAKDVLTCITIYGKLSEVEIGGKLYEKTNFFCGGYCTFT